MTDFRKEPLRCVCMIGGDAHRVHGNPKNQTGKHLDPRCPHSELYNTLVRFPEIHKAKARKRRSREAMPRHVGS